MDHEVQIAIPSEQGRFSYESEGRRYIAWKDETRTKLIKVLYSQTRPRNGMHRQRFQALSPERKKAEIFKVHKREYEVTEATMGKVVLPAEFFESTIDSETAKALDPKGRIMSGKNFFMRQEYIHNGMTIFQALGCARSNSQQFLEGLQILLKGYKYIARLYGFVPEIYPIGGRNTLVNESGQIFIVDTNNMLPVRNEIYEQKSLYVKRFKAAKSGPQDPYTTEITDAFTTAIQNAIQKLKGESNP